MSRTVLITSEPVAQFSGPPTDRMAGRPRRAAAQGGGHFVQAAAARPKVSAATEARANSFLDREALLDAAVYEAVIGSGLRAHYAECYDKDPEGTRSYLQSLGLRTVSTHSTAAASSDEYDESVLSKAERGRIAAAREGRTPRVIQGGL